MVLTFNLDFYHPFLSTKILIQISGLPTPRKPFSPMYFAKFNTSSGTSVWKYYHGEGFRQPALQCYVTHLQLHTYTHTCALVQCLPQAFDSSPMLRRALTGRTEFRTPTPLQMPYNYLPPTQTSSYPFIPACIEERLPNSITTFRTINDFKGARNKLRAPLKTHHGIRGKKPQGHSEYVARTTENTFRIFLGTSHGIS